MWPIAWLGDGLCRQKQARPRLIRRCPPDIFTSDIFTSDIFTSDIFASDIFACYVWRDKTVANDTGERPLGPDGEPYFPSGGKGCAG